MKEAKEKAIESVTIRNVTIRTMRKIGTRKERHGGVRRKGEYRSDDEEEWKGMRKRKRRTGGLIGKINEEGKEKKKGPIMNACLSVCLSVLCFSSRWIK